MGPCYMVTAQKDVPRRDRIIMILIVGVIDANQGVVDCSDRKVTCRYRFRLRSRVILQGVESLESFGRALSHLKLHNPVESKPKKSQTGIETRAPRITTADSIHLASSRPFKPPRILRGAQGGWVRIFTCQVIHVGGWLGLI